MYTLMYFGICVHLGNYHQIKIAIIPIHPRFVLCNPSPSSSSTVPRPLFLYIFKSHYFSRYFCQSRIFAQGPAYFGGVPGFQCFFFFCLQNIFNLLFYTLINFVLCPFHLCLLLIKCFEIFSLSYK